MIPRFGWGPPKKAKSALRAPKPDWAADKTYGPKNVAELRHILGQRGLPQSGNKGALVERLNESDDRISKGNLEPAHINLKRGARKFKFFMRLPAEVRAMIYDHYLLQQWTKEYPIGSTLPELSAPPPSNGDPNESSDTVRPTDEYIFHPSRQLEQPQYGWPSLAPRKCFKKILVDDVLTLLRVSPFIRQDALPSVYKMLTFSFEIRIPGIADLGWWDHKGPDVLQLRRVPNSTQTSGSDEVPEQAPDTSLRAPFKISEQKRVKISLQGPVHDGNDDHLGDASVWGPAMTTHLENLVERVLLPSKLLYLEVVMDLTRDLLDHHTREQIINPILKPLEVLRGLREVELTGFDGTPEYEEYLIKLLTSPKPQVRNIAEAKSTLEEGSTLVGEDSALLDEGSTLIGEGSSIFGGGEGSKA